MSCPSCGRRGNVPPDRLNSKLHCKKCDAVFHMDMSGKVVLGEPPSARPKSETIKAHKAEEFDPIGALAARLMKTPKPIVYLFGAAAIGTLGYFVLGATGLLGQGPMPLEPTAQLIGEAFVDKDQGTLKSYAASGTSGDVARWYEQERPKFGDYGRQDQGNDVIVTPGLLSGNSEEGPATVLLMLLPPPKPDGKVDPPTKLTTAWKKEDGRWRLDGTQTLSAATASPGRK